MLETFSNVYIWIELKVTEERGLNDVFRVNDIVELSFGLYGNPLKTFTKLTIYPFTVHYPNEFIVDEDKKQDDFI